MSQANITALKALKLHGMAANDRKVAMVRDASTASAWRQHALYCCL